jgi:Rad3-related DNA helicase
MVVEEDQEGHKKAKNNNESIDNDATIGCNNNQQNQQTNQHQTEEAIGSTNTSNQRNKTMNWKEKQLNNGCRPGSRNFNKFIAIQKRAEKIIKNRAKQGNITNQFDDDTIKTISVCEEKTVTTNIDDDTLLDGLSQVSDYETNLVVPKEPNEKMQSKFFICC